MKKYAVGLMNFFDNELQVKIVSAETGKEAIITARVNLEGDYSDGVKTWLKDLPDDLEGIKQFFFDTDECVDVTEC